MIPVNKFWNKNIFDFRNNKKNEKYFQFRSSCEAEIFRECRKLLRWSSVELAETSLMPSFDGEMDDKLIFIHSFMNTEE